MHDDTIALITFYSIKKMLESLSNKDIKEAMNNYSETLKDNTKIYSKDLIDTLFAYPYTKIESLEKTCNISKSISFPNSLRHELQLKVTLATTLPLNVYLP